MTIASCRPLLIAALATTLFTGNTQPSSAGSRALSPTIDPEWSVSVVSSNEDTLWVDLRILNANVLGNPCAFFACESAIVYYQVTPCPLSGPACLGGTTEQGLFATTHAARIGLQIGLTYTFSGRFEALGLTLGSDGRCSVLQCTYVQNPPDKVFNTTPLNAEPTTWGKVKALYRVP